MASISTTSSRQPTEQRNLVNERDAREAGAEESTKAAVRNVYVVGGQQRRPRSLREMEESWYNYHKGLILEVDTRTGDVVCSAEYVSPPALCADGEPAILFKSGTLQGDKLYVCTQTEVLIYAIPDFELLSHLSLPCFNDVHHVRPTPDGNLLIANSGLDMVLEVTPDGAIVREWNTLGEEPWSQFCRETDYRRVASTKPHRSHPNQVFYIEDNVWVTRFQQKDAICLTEPGQRIAVDSALAHDGLVHDGRVYFTTVDGFIVVADAATKTVDERIDLNALESRDAHLGWCRGILVDDDKVWVGFTRLRMTKFRENLSWVRWGFKQHLPTRIACYDLAHRRRLTEVDLQAHGLDAVFSIVPGPADAV